MAVERQGPCQVCGRVATVLVNWSILSCGGCSVFHKRAVKNNIHYVCRFSGKCPTTHIDSSRMCRACRFQKCVAVGMQVLGRRQKPHGRSSTQALVPKITNVSNADAAVRDSRFDEDVDDVISNASSSSCQEQNLLTPISDRGSLDQPENSSHLALCLDSSIPPWCVASVEGYMYETLIHQVPLFSDTTDHQDVPPSSLVPRRRSQQMNLQDLWLMQLPRQIQMRQDTMSECHPNPVHYLDMMGSTTHDQMMATANAVGVAAQHVFGDQIIYWTSHMENCLRYGTSVRQPQTSLEEMSWALNYHGMDCVKRIVKFGAFLPGMNDLAATEKGCITAGWKWLIYILIHHAPFMTNLETYFTIGSQQYEYCRYWQELITEWPLMVGLYKLGTMFRDIGLDEVERYLVIAIVMLEPGTYDAVSGESVNLQRLHRHYGDVLVDSIKRRCTDPERLSSVCLKLERFFSLFEDMFRLHDFYYNSNLTRTQCPPCSIEAKKLVLQLHEKTAMHQDCFSLISEDE